MIIDSLVENGRSSQVLFLVLFLINPECSSRPTHAKSLFWQQFSLPFIEPVLRFSQIASYTWMHIYTLSLPVGLLLIFEVCGNLIIKWTLIHVLYNTTLKILPSKDWLHFSSSWIWAGFFIFSGQQNEQCEVCQLKTRLQVALRTCILSRNLPWSEKKPKMAC